MKIFFLLLIALNISVARHPLHVSVTEISMNEKEKRLEITMRVFIDDLEETMRKKLHQPAFDILKPPVGITIDNVMRDYFKSHFKLSLDKKDYVVTLLGHETDGDAFVFYLEVDRVKKWKSIEVTNDSMTETFEDQSNLVHVTVRDVVHSLRLNGTTPSGVLTFDVK